MKNVSLLKSNATNSPKTPGGISKSLLTPCRRLGLSRNWRNKGPSPFISPLAGGTQEVKEEKIEPRKRKQRVLDDNVESTPETFTVDENEIELDRNNDIDKTPSRNVELPRRKRSKTLLAAINKSQDDIVAPSMTNNKDRIITMNEDTSEKGGTQNTENVDVVSTPVRTKSKKSTKQSPRVKSNSQTVKICSNSKPKACNDESTNTNVKNSMETPDTVYEIKEKSPNDLKKECIVVIQRKLFKKPEDSEKVHKDTKLKRDKKEKPSSQSLFDYDSDETPLIQLNKESSKSKTEITEEEQIANKAENIKDLNGDDDFIDKSSKIQSNKVKDIKSNNKLKTIKITEPKAEKPKLLQQPPSQSSFDDDDDFDNNKKTILIRKTYEKVSKPSKAKSTGSITQKDIDELKARIEAKKRLLLAQSINPDTEELRNLIKKWQKGCQDALIELLDLMKTKVQDKQDMDYAEMLKSLKIPPSLVGYDAENDCFNEPSDAYIILGQFEDII